MLESCLYVPLTIQEFLGRLLEVDAGLLAEHFVTSFQLSFTIAQTLQHESLRAEFSVPGAKNHHKREQQQMTPLFCVREI